MTFLRCEIPGDGTATLVLDHPEKRNALSQALGSALIEGLDRLRCAGIRAVVLRAAPGVRVWSSGHDIDELPTSARDPLGWSEPLRRLVRALQEFPAPILALVEGGVWGGACEVVFACDLVIATPDATFAITPGRLGVPYNAPGLQNLRSAMPAALLRELLFTALPVSAERAHQLGLINHLVPAAEIGPFTARMAATIASNAPLTLAAIKEILRILDDALPLSTSQVERLLTLRDGVARSEDYQEGLSAFRERRPPIFRGR